MKKVKKEKLLEYSVLFEPAKEGGYVVTVPKLYGLTTEGDTFEEAKSMAQDVIKGYIESLISQGKKVPVEKSDKAFVFNIPVSVPEYSRYVTA
ncbi:type II toxin-antitoxin system HicB family antitoxin [Candidatus Collierbacteria bacterium]|nr:type II toxin-antitoxin system HicB family antitoxin [Candidatus Collierbacteria bacterium]